MIPTRLRLFFAKERRPLLLGHLALALALVPIPIARTGWAEFTAVLILFPFQAPPTMGFVMLAGSTLFLSPLVPLFLVWSLPGAGRSGLPLRSIVVLCLLVVYHPLQSYFESHFYGEFVARVADSFSQESPLIWFVRHLDTPLLIALTATALRRRRTLPPFWKVTFQWSLFVCVLWATGHPYDSVFFDILLLHAFGM